MDRSLVHIPDKPIKSRVESHNEIAAQMAEYEANGGKVEQIARGVLGYDDSRTGKERKKKGERGAAASKLSSERRGFKPLRFEGKQ